MSDWEVVGSPTRREPPSLKKLVSWLAGTEASTTWSPLAPGLKTSMLLSESGMNWLRLGGLNGKKTLAIIWVLLQPQKPHDQFPLSQSFFLFECTWSLHLYTARAIWKRMEGKGGCAVAEWSKVLLVRENKWKPKPKDPRVRPSLRKKKQGWLFYLGHLGLGANFG